MVEQRFQHDTIVDKESCVRFAPFAVLALTKEATVAGVNPAGERFAGQSAETLVGRRFGEVFSCTNAKISGECGAREACRDCPMRAAIKQVLNSGAPLHDREIRLDNDSSGGRSRFYLASVLPSSVAGGEEQVLAVLSDITERKLIESALRESEERYRLLSDVTMEGILIHREGTLLDANVALARMFGYQPGELRGRNVIAEAVHEEDRPLVLARVGKESTEPYVVRCYRKNGDLFYAEFEARNMVIRDETMRVVAVRDVTERRLAEQARERLLEQLHQAQKMESLGSLAGGEAHDFNNLLQAMSGNIHMLLRNRDDDNLTEKRLHVVAGAIDRAAYLVRQLLLFSRKAELRRQPVDIRQSIGSAVAMLERTIPRMVSFELRLDSELPLIHADPIQVEQVLLNLATNAVDAMAGCGTLTVTADSVEFSDEQAEGHGLRAGHFVVLSIADTGQGMDRATREQMFDPFFTTKEPGKGTGLGLASVYGVVTGHEGAITCNSSPGEGTTFTIYWPVSAEQQVIPVQLPALERQGTGSETVLVVDDEAQIRDLTREVLIDFNYQVVLTASGEEALQVFAKQPGSVDLVILDMNMPGMGGYRCLQELRLLDPSVPVLISSGYAGSGPVQEALQAGASGFIAKPYLLTELLSVVRSLLDGSPSRHVA
ncbi:MAG: PAS domain S-box protein [Desulfofustis sp.]|jgi:PAS domain S-box-containing protein|nr:PAS domain S-box protein [Desulfofustis sp.]